jgi:hypothetical protein
MSFEGAVERCLRLVAYLGRYLCNADIGRFEKAGGDL